MVYTLWIDDKYDACDEITLLVGELGPEGHRLLHRIEATDINDACRQRNELLGWEPYKPMEDSQ